MITIKNVLVEITDKAINIASKQVPVYTDLYNSKTIGYAKLELREDGLYADLYLNEKPGDGLFWPAIKYRTDPNTIIQIGLYGNKNVDDRVKPINFDLLS